MSVTQLCAKTVPTFSKLPDCPLDSSKQPSLANTRSEPLLERHISAVKHWLLQNDSQYLRLSQVSVLVLDDICSTFEKQGLKLRYDWYPSSQTAVLNMPSSVHDFIGGWLGGFLHEIEATLVSNARCGTPQLMSLVSSGITLVGGLTMQPDQQFCLSLDFGESGEVVMRRPRVVLETARTESLPHVMGKVWNYLHKTEEDIHAVILCNITGGGQSKQKFRADFTIWTRSESDKIEDLPFEKSSDINHDPPPNITSENPLFFHTKGRPDVYPQQGDGEKIYSRIESSVVIYDEAKESNNEPEQAGVHVEEQHLVLYVHDFLRRCPQHTTAPLSHEKISIPLGTLRKGLMRCLMFERDKLDQRLVFPSSM